VSGGLVIINRLTCDSVSDPNGFVQAFSESTGALVWDSGPPFESNPVSELVVASGYVVSVGGSPGGGQLITVRQVSNGAIVWQQTPDNDRASPALVVDGLVIQQEQSSLVAYNLQTGAQVWSRAGLWQPERGDLAAPGGAHLYAVSPAGQVADLNPRNGSTQRVLASATSVLAVDHARAYASCGSGRICAYRTADGTLAWSLADGSGLAAEAGGAAGVLYLSDGQAVSAATGQLLRRIFTGSATELAVGQGRIAVSLSATKLSLYGLAGS
jgi:outer membrane protein assembly factor BamB